MNLMLRWCTFSLSISTYRAGFRVLVCIIIYLMNVLLCGRRRTISTSPLTKIQSHYVFVCCFSCYQHVQKINSTIRDSMMNITSGRIYVIVKEKDNNHFTLVQLLLHVKLWSQNLKQQYVWFVAIANQMRQLPIQSNGQVCYGWRV